MDYSLRTLIEPTTTYMQTRGPKRHRCWYACWHFCIPSLSWIVSIIEPHFRFCCSVWGVCSGTSLNKLQKLQNRAARIATNSPYDAPSQPLLRKLGWNPIKELVDIETTMMVYKSINNEAPNYLTSLFERLSQNTIRELRNTKTDLKMPLLKTSSGQKCFSYRGARLWNNLSVDAKSAKTQTQFKKLIKNQSLR